MTGKSERISASTLSPSKKPPPRLPMRKEYDFSDSVRNPYAKHLKKQVTLRLNTDAVSYFKALAKETGIPYQNLINLYLTECAHSGKKLTLKWAS